MKNILTVRKQLWHLRHGGIKQLRAFTLREQAEGRGVVQRPHSGLSLLWRSHATNEVPAVRKDTKLASGYRLEFEPAEALSLPLTYPDIRVAVVLDDFSLQAWSAEFKTVVLKPDTWQQQLLESPVDFLLVESAWSGNGGSWQYYLTGQTAPRPAVRELTRWCSEHGIPTAFWNKEDPPHFNDFLETARLFDYVFTSDSNMVPLYQAKLGHKRVYPLSFAAAPTVHNPVRSAAGGASRGVAFAGTYFAHKFPERRAQMDFLLAGAAVAARKSNELFEVYSRFLGKDDRYQFPASLSKYVVGALPYSQMLRAYKAHKVFLNVNSVVGSPSMCARRIFEILACGTPVVSTDSVAIRRFFNDDQLLVTNDRQDAENKIRSLLNSPVLRERSVHLAQREIWAKHTYAHRAKQLIDTIKVTATPHPRSFVANPKVSVIAPTMRPGQIKHIFETVGRQKGVRAQLVLLTHGFELSQDAAQKLAQQCGVADLVVVYGSPELSLGSCLNLLVEHAAGDVLAKMDDDDIYGDFYLVDSVRALMFSGADVVGKNAHYMYLKNLNITILRRPEREHQFTDFIAGPTITGWASVFKKHPFEDRTTGEDTAFLQSVVNSGGTIYAADKYSFIQQRTISSDHTWQVDDYHLLANGTASYYGDNRQVMMF
ncbi:glycosyltransferase [Rothia sp. (in: high G+C Gram-positive bacteria)]|uniref:glycosyltransferase family protein n=1 Tax=Rothia sp. (in: high G+C Gram-positive bacteria) TaxID=1885016 RepID=UPI003216EC21